MNEFLEQLESAVDGTADIAPLDMLFVLFLSFALSLAVAALYRHTHRGALYSQSYVHTLVMMGTVVALVMLIIGSNIARAFALVGALSIIRFRNAVKETRDVGFIFMVMALGMAVGTRHYVLALLSTALLSVFMILLTRLDLFAKDGRVRILRIRVPVATDYESAFAGVFRQHLVDHRLVSLETVRAGVLQEIVYQVVLRPKTDPKELLEALRGQNENNKVMLVMGQEEVEA